MASFSIFRGMDLVINMFEGHQIWYTLSDGSDNPPVYFQEATFPRILRGSLSDYYLGTLRGRTKEHLTNKSNVTLFKIFLDFFSKLNR